MALFQASVLSSYLKLQEEEKLTKAFKKFSKCFHHPEIQENIRNSKEEQFQAHIMNELFVNVLGYIPLREFSQLRTCCTHEITPAPRSLPTLCLLQPRKYRNRLEV